MKLDHKAMWYRWLAGGRDFSFSVTRPTFADFFVFAASAVVVLIDGK
jgi:hypothetical protein